MVLAAPPANVAGLQAICDLFDVELTDIGAFTDSGRLIVRYADRLVLDLANDFLHDGIPQRQLQATADGGRQTAANTSALHRPPSAVNSNTLLLALLSHPTLASKADVIRVYDHEVQGGTVVKPLTGAQNDGPSDACVLKPAGTKGARGIVLSNGINPQYGKLDPYRMALSAVDEAIRNAVAVGADPEHIALLDNFCWGDPSRPETLGALVEAARGCHDAALHYNAPFISGKDSLNNEYLGADGQRHAIPGTLLISAIALIEDVSRAVTMDLKAAGDVVYLLGETRGEFGGSHLDLLRVAYSVHATHNTQHVPDMPAYAATLYRALHAAMRAGLVRACHDLSEGGLAVAAAEMCLGGRLGLALTLTTDDPATALFSESNGRLLAEVKPADCAEFERRLAGLPCARLGTVTGGNRLTITTSTETLISLTVAELVSAWQSGVGD
jgi:phosphoribosylformylglycinamidine synthase